MPRRPFHLQEPVDFNQFGGLYLAPGPDEPARQALAATDVDLNVTGAVRSRDGDVALNGTAQTWLRLASIGSAAIFGSSATAVYAISPLGGSVLASDAPGSFQGPHYFAAFGTPSTDTVYYTALGSVAVPRVYTVGSTSFGAVTWTGAVTPHARLVAVTPVDNRLVLAGTTGAAADGPSTVRFSKAGDATNFATNDYVQLHPGDGEYIAALATWGNLLFVFKQSKFFVFIGNSVDPQGNPVFNYRTVDAKLGVLDQDNVMVGRDGVYFVTDGGVYRTAGSAPIEVSTAIAPIFRTAAAPYGYDGDIIDTSKMSLARTAWVNDRLYVALTEQNQQSPVTNNVILVYDSHAGQWVRWRMSGGVLGLTQAPAASGPDAGRQRLHWARDGAILTVTPGQAFPGPGALNPNQTATWQSWYTDLGSSSQKTLWGTQLWGSGNVSLSVAADFATTFPAATNFTLGSPAIARGTRRVGTRGFVFSHFLQGGGAWNVQRVTHILQFTRTRDPAETAR